MKVLLVPSDMPEAQDHARMLAARLTVAGVDVAVQPAGDSAPLAVPAQELALVVPMGGDGTFLHAAHLIDFASVPMLGFNYGTLGFLSGNPDKDELELVVDALSGDLLLERRSTLDVVITDAAGVEHSYTALNEVAYTRGASGHVVEYAYNINGVPIARLKADGLVVATATGSTAYALSAGGPIVSPGYSGLVAVPLAAHALGVRPIVMAPSDVLEAEMYGRSFDEASVFLDGWALDIEGPKELVVRQGEREITFVRGGDDFFASVSKIFFQGGAS